MTERLKAICRRLIELSSGNISNLVLQKLLYLIQAYSLVDENQPEPAFDDRIEAWQYGPVVPEAYYGFKYNLNEIRHADVDFLNPNLERRIREIYETFGRQDPFDLVNLTHSYDSWINAWRNPFDSTITNDDIVKCHSQLIHDTEFIF